MTEKTRKPRVVTEPYQTNTGPEITIGQWTWKTELLERKIVKTGTDDCHAWIGSTGPNAPLFGAAKSGKKQMTQAPRLWWMQNTGTDCADLQITHTCGNNYCMNFNHFATLPNQQRFYRDGTPRGTRPAPEPKQKRRAKAVQETTTNSGKWWLE